MPEICEADLHALVDDAKKIGRGLESVSEVSITLVGRGAPPPPYALTSGERATVAYVRAQIMNDLAHIGGSVCVDKSRLEMLLVIVERLGGR